MASSLVLIVYPIASVVVFLFGCFAVLYTYLRPKEGSTEFFLTARHSANTFRFVFGCVKGFFSDKIYMAVSAHPKSGQHPTRVNLGSLDIQDIVFLLCGRHGQLGKLSGKSLHQHSQHVS